MPKNSNKQTTRSSARRVVPPDQQTGAIDMQYPEQGHTAVASSSRSVHGHNLRRTATDGLSQYFPQQLASQGQQREEGESMIIDHPMADFHDQHSINAEYQHMEDLSTMLSHSQDIQQHQRQHHLAIPHQTDLLQNLRIQAPNEGENSNIFTQDDAVSQNTLSQIYPVVPSQQYQTLNPAQQHYLHHRTGHIITYANLRPRPPDLPHDPNARMPAPPPPYVPPERPTPNNRCHECNIGFTRNFDLGRHNNTVHLLNAGALFPCDVEGCERMYRPFRRNDKLLEHRRDVHGLANPTRP